MRTGVLASLLVLGYFTAVNSINETPLQEDNARNSQRKNEPNCPVTLPQKTSNDCRSLREKELDRQRNIYQFVSRPPMPMPRINLTFPQLFAQFSKDEFFKEHLDNYVGMLTKNKDFTTKWLKEHPGEIHNFQGYKDMIHDFRTKLTSNGSTGLFQFVSNIEPFRDILEDWRDDGIFAMQRLSGNNPLVIRRVTEDSSDVGLRWSELLRTLNPKYDWEAAIQRASGNDDPLEETIKMGNVYVLRYKEFDEMASFPDAVDLNPNRTVWPTTSPVALFTMRSKGTGKRLRPAAIQIDHKQDSPVFSPVDGDSWMLAKMVVQATDYAHSQMIEHLLRIHLFAEPICMALYRHMPPSHPLNELLKYHCRGLVTANTIGAPPLFWPKGYMDRLSAMGRQGAMLLIIRGYQTLGWNNADLLFDMKKRGLDDKKMLPYFPYRDDSMLILKAIKGMVKEYVNIYYPRNIDIKKDKELKAFVKELTAGRRIPNGGYGQLVKGFPTKLRTKREVINVVAKLVWLISVKHAAVNFPVSDYGAFTPLMPTKVYNDTRVPPGKFAVYNFPNGLISTTQALVAVNVGIYHYDTLFDYYSELSSPEASQVVERYYNYLKGAITKRLKMRNDKRLQSGRLTYPYLQYPWIPNGAST